jgi:hypothetical protein
VTITYISDHAEQALARLPARYRDQPNIEALVRVLCGPVQTLEDALWTLIAERGIDTATGVTLDTIGDIVGEPRTTQTATNRSNGTVPALLRVTRVLVDDVVARVVVGQPGAAAVTVTIEDIALPDALADVVIAFLRQAKAAGVRLLLYSSSAEPEATFTFDATEDLGFPGGGETGGSFSDART